MKYWFEPYMGVEFEKIPTDYLRWIVQNKCTDETSPGHREIMGILRDREFLRGNSALKSTAPQPTNPPPAPFEKVAQLRNRNSRQQHNYERKMKEQGLKVHTSPYFSAGKFKGKKKSLYDTKFLQVYLNTTPDIHPVLSREICEVLEARKPPTYLNWEKLAPQKQALAPWEEEPAKPTKPLKPKPHKPLQDQEKTGVWPPPGYKTFPTPQWLIDEYPDIPRVLCEWKPEDEPINFRMIWVAQMKDDEIPF